MATIAEARELQEKITKEYDSGGGVNTQSIGVQVRSLVAMLSSDELHESIGSSEDFNFVCEELTNWSSFYYRNFGTFLRMRPPPVPY